MRCHAQSKAVQTSKRYTARVKVGSVKKGGGGGAASENLIVLGASKAPPEKTLTYSGLT